MNILIIDNEVLLRNGLRTLIESTNVSVTAISEADGVATGLAAIERWKPDVVFLDIEMEDGTGFDLLKQVHEPTFQLIFTTAYNQYAIEAFKFSAIDYLLKPIDPVELSNSLQKAAKFMSRSGMMEQLTVLLQQLQQQNDPEKKIVLKDVESIYFIRIADILFCEAEGTYTKFHIKDADSILVSKNLKEYEGVLQSSGFLRTHHSYLVNPSKIKIYDKTDGGTLILESGHTIPVSQRKREYILQVLEKK